jgi:signal transduction histidine kinase
MNSLLTSFKSFMDDREPLDMRRSRNVVFFTSILLSITGITYTLVSFQASVWATLLNISLLVLGMAGFLLHALKVDRAALQIQIWGVVFILNAFVVLLGEVLAVEYFILVVFLLLPFLIINVPYLIFLEAILIISFLFSKVYSRECEPLIRDPFFNIFYYPNMFVALISSLVLFVIILRSLKMKQDQLLERTRRLEQSNNARQRMINILSHDLRSPLNSLVSLLDLQKLGELDDASCARHLESIGVRTEEMLESLDHLLYWAYGEIDRKEFNTEEVNLREEVDTVLKFLVLLVKEKEVRVENRVEEEPAVLVDRNHFQLVMRNLLTNAVKFSRKGDTVRVSAERKECMIAVHVMDEGIGLDGPMLKDDLHVREGTAGEKGTGLGLKLCHEIAELNDGYIESRTNEAGGATFSFYLPSCEDGPASGEQLPL